MEEPICPGWTPPGASAGTPVAFPLPESAHDGATALFDVVVAAVAELDFSVLVAGDRQEHRVVTAVADLDVVVPGPEGPAVGAAVTNLDVVVAVAHDHDLVAAVADLDIVIARPERHAVGA